VNRRLQLGGGCPKCERELLVITDLPEDVSMADGGLVEVEVHCDRCNVDFTLEDVDVPDSVAREALTQRRC
jgi:hypothetical protein